MNEKVWSLRFWGRNVHEHLGGPLAPLCPLSYAHELLLVLAAKENEDQLYGKELDGA